jgi:putative membrane protein
MASRSMTNQIHPGFVVWLLITLGINVLALIVINWLFDSVWIQGFWSYALGALALTIGNAFLKPILALLTLPLIIFTLGLAYFAINVAMLALAEWIAPNFSIDGFWTYVGATIVVWIVNIAMQALLGGLTGRRARRITG